jgi:HSP20 family protein
MRRSLLKAAQFKGREGIARDAFSAFNVRSLVMYFAPALRTRSYAPARGFDRNFERFLSDAFFAQSQGALKVEQSDEAWTLSLDVPGVAREQLTLEVDGTVVRLATVADAPRQFKAAYELPAEIDADTTSAKLEHGVLTLTLGKKKPVVTTRTIAVQ